MRQYKRYAAALLFAAALAGCGGVQAPGSSSVKAPVIAEKDKEAPAAPLPQGPVPLPENPAPAPSTAPSSQPANPGTNPTQVAPAPPGNQVLSFNTLQRGAYSGVTERKVVLVTDEAAWKSNWQQISARQVPAPDAPALDFAGQSVIVASLGEKNTGGYSVEVTGVELVGGKLKVTVRETKPGPGTFVTQALTQPYHVVRIPKVPAGTTVEVVWQ
jgi:hypothetical protein